MISLTLTFGLLFLSNDNFITCDSSGLRCSKNKTRDNHGDCVENVIVNSSTESKDYTDYFKEDSVNKTELKSSKSDSQHHKMPWHVMLIPFYFLIFVK